MQSPKPLRSRVYSWVLVAVASLGLFDAVLLTKQHYSGLILPCNVTKGCETVLSSKYSVVFGVPLAVLGLVFYTTVLLVAVSYALNRAAVMKSVLLALGTVGFVSSMGLVYLQGAVLHAWCQYCLLSALSSTAIFVLSAIIYKRKEEVSSEEA